MEIVEEYLVVLDSVDKCHEYLLEVYYDGFVRDVFLGLSVIY